MTLNFNDDDYDMPYLFSSSCLNLIKLNKYIYTIYFTLI